MIPLWKVRRELARLGQQLRAVPGAVLDPLAQRRLDARVAAGLPMVEGAIPPGPKVALVLVWQPKGIPDSLIATCRWLAAGGHAPLVVSNAPLSAADRVRLAPVVWRAVERPNFGYDFGGYRDGLTCLRQWGVAPERLVILNDSVWVPLREPCDLLGRLAAAPFDVAGSVLRRRGDERFLESYLYSIRGEVLDHPAFRAFWDGLRLTSNKYLVIRRGERGFSRALIAAGLRVGGLYTPEAFLAAAEAAPDAELAEVLRFAAHPDDTVQARLRGLADGACCAGGRGPALAEMRATLEKAQFYSTFPVGAARWLGYPLLKKSAEPVSARWRAAFCEAVGAGVLPAPSGLDEMQRAPVVGVGQG